MKKETTIALALLTGCTIFLAPLQGQGLHLKGQLWGGVTWGNDPAYGHSDIEETIGYIPALSLARQFGPLTLVDMELAYRYSYSALLDGAFGRGKAGINTTTKLYRLWGRLATEKLELRLGLQKIAFGPGKALRPLMWFDTLDPRDPTGQTEGVAAVRLRWHPIPSLALLGWVIRPDSLEVAAPGGRIEYTFGPGKVALTYYHHKANDLDFAPKSLLPFDEAEKRLALDARLDWKVGLWTEMMLARGDEPSPFDEEFDELAQIMVGVDYTFPWGAGIYVMVEHFWSRLDFARPIFIPSPS